MPLPGHGNAHRRFVWRLSALNSPTSCVSHQPRFKPPFPTTPCAPKCLSPSRGASTWATGIPAAPAARGSRGSPQPREVAQLQGFVEDCEAFVLIQDVHCLEHSREPLLGVPRRFSLENNLCQKTNTSRSTAPFVGHASAHEKPTSTSFANTTCFQEFSPECCHSARPSGRKQHCKGFRTAMYAAVTGLQTPCFCLFLFFCRFYQGGKGLHRLHRPNQPGQYGLNSCVWVGGGGGIKKPYYFVAMVLGNSLQ